MFRRVLVANRGAIARRVVRACSALGIESVAVYSDADAGAPYLAEATAAAPLAGVEAADTYLNAPALLAIAHDHGCDAVHPGYGFLSERADFATQVAAAGLRFIGPEPSHLELLGSKVAARAHFAALGFPMHDGSELVASATQAVQAAERLGYPVLLKPSDGGGGIGMVRVASAADLEHSFARAQAMAQAAFGSDALYVERWVEAARHIELQVLGDGQGGAVHLFERECSVQRRHQKVIEEAGAPGVDRSALDGLAARAAAALADLAFCGVATVETLMDAEQRFGFLEVNPRIQVEHGVTEMVTGADLVAAQLRIAAGLPLPSRPALSGHAIQLRLYAEDARTQAPSTGRLSRFRLPHMHGVRLETGYAEGQFVTPFYDPLLAKIIVHGPTRAHAIGRALVALRGVEVAGVATNAALLAAVLESDAFVAGTVHTRFLDTFEW